MKTISSFLGIDVGSESITVGAYTQFVENYVSHSFDNNISGFKELSTWLAKHNIDSDSSVICIENTGVYSEAILYYLFKKGFRVALESPIHLKKTFREGPKTDPEDTRQIAEYAYRYLDRLNFWQPPEELLEMINTLLTLREQYVGQNTAEKNLLTSLSKKQVKSEFTLNMLKETIEERNQKIQQIEKELSDLIKKDPDLKIKIDGIKSIKSIGLLFALNFYCITDGFSKRCNPRQLTAYLGISPHNYQSGKTVFRKPRSKGFGPARLRKLLYLASMSIVQHDVNMKQYYLRKLAEGKPKRLVLNNVGNKIIKIACSILKNENNYIPGYRSINPALI